MLQLLTLWALAGWCGNEPRPFPKPQPVPWFLSRFIGLVSGIAGGWLYTQVFKPEPVPWTNSLEAAASAAGAFLLARFVTGLYGRLSGGTNIAGG